MAGFDFPPNTRLALVLPVLSFLSGPTLSLSEELLAMDRFTIDVLQTAIEDLHAGHTSPVTNGTPLKHRVW